ncbi:putative serine/threonine-protein kinase PBL7 [Bidens hawaiensis]|uniref:putative serine/threonine-protein kinase PBL7 n=1 Tax=Bidens hawaiensis TaxID=980011 RepID=UPI00404A662E
MSFMKDFNHLKIQMKDIVLATNSFETAKVMGSGGFGRVYKGELSSPEGLKTFAFKKLDRRLGQGNIEFWKEVMMLSKYKHENLISLMHFCIEGDEMILVYEYASRGSLDRYLSDANTLTWIQRLRVCVGAARGLHFLSDPKETQQRVLHRDIKSANILLDENWIAKVSDFGLSKLGPANQAHTYLVSHGVGTPGYCDPLYMELGYLSKESDVYSFGVVLFEILCGRLCYKFCNREHTKIFVPKWRLCYDEKRLDEIVLPGLEEQMGPGSLKLFSAIAYQCVKKTREERPTMAKIMKTLVYLLKQQESFENSHRERTSLRHRGQTVDDDHRQMFKSSQFVMLLVAKQVYDYSMVNNRFHDLDDGDCSQSSPVSDSEESDDSEEDSERRQRRRSILLPKKRWDYYNSHTCPEDQFRKVFE